MALEGIKTPVRWSVALVVAAGVALGAVLAERVEERTATRKEERAAARSSTPEPPQPPGDAYFSSSWETCTGVADSCLRDVNEGNWESFSQAPAFSPDSALQVLVGGGIHPAAIDGANILGLYTKDLAWGGVRFSDSHPTGAFDLTSPDNYMRMYLYVPSDNGLGSTGGHFFQSVGAGSTIFYYHHVAPSATQVTFGYTVVGGLWTACRLNNYNLVNINKTVDPVNFAIETDKWYRMELHIECPNNDACLNVPYRSQRVGVRVNFRTYEVTNVALGTEILVADNGDGGAPNAYYAHDYGGVYGNYILSELYNGSVSGFPELACIDGGDRSYYIGPNGASGSDIAYKLSMYVDGVRTCTDNWCGSAF